MPSPWKTAGVTRFISGLRSKRAGSSLVVETGFPTSLADLVVKNRGRLKKPSRKKKPSPAAGPDPDTTAAAAARSPPGCGGGALRSTAIGEDPRPPEIRYPVPVEMKSRGCGFWFRFLAAKLVVLTILAIGRKKLVAVITILAFGLLLLELVGFRVFEFLRPCSDARRSLNSVVGRLDLGGRERVSPIREVRVKSQSESLGSGRSWEESMGLDQGSEVLLERQDLVVVRKVSADPNAGSSGNFKAKKLWRKIIRKKFRGSRDGMDAKELDLGSSGSSVSDHNRKEEEEVPKEQEEEEQTDEEILSFNISDEVSHFDTADACAIRENVGGTRLLSSKQLVFFVIVLSGLMGGKTVALVVTVACYLVTIPIGILWRKWKVHRIGSSL